MARIRIGTRESTLALWQAHYVRDALIRAEPKLVVQLIGMTTEGDRRLDTTLAAHGGKGLFLKELEQALLDDRIDIAVHSMKDVTVTLPDGLHIGAVCEREDPRDALVSLQYPDLDALPPQACVGTSSLRRQCWLRNRYPNLRVETVRGNVQTRLSRLDEGKFDALVLAVAGLRRLGLEHRIAQVIPTDIALPAVGQGAVGIECRRDDMRVKTLLGSVNHTDTETCVRAERAANAALGGGCHVPVAAYAVLRADRLHVRGMVGTPDGVTVLHAHTEGPAAEPEAIGARIAADLLKDGARSILEKVNAAG